VQQNYLTLYDCISSKKLIAIHPPDISNCVASSSSQQTQSTSATTQLTSTDVQQEDATGDDDDESETESDDETGSNGSSVSSKDEEIIEAKIDWTQIPPEFSMKRFEVDYSNYVCRNQLRTDDLSQLFGLLKGLISADSATKIKAHSDYSTAKKTRNGFMLWMIMFKSHQISNMYLAEPAQRSEASRNFYSYHQYSGVSLSEYHTTFKNFLHVMKEVKAKLPSNEEIAAAFTNGLNDEYFGELKNQLANAAHFHLSVPVTSLKPMRLLQIIHL